VENDDGAECGCSREHSVSTRNAESERRLDTSLYCHHGVDRGIVFLAPLMNEVTNVPIERTEGFKFLFLDFTNKVTEYVQLEGFVTPEWLPVAIMNIIGFYFGSAAMQRR
jgi:hypothetical protein